jgi:hypothetical protein
MATSEEELNRQKQFNQEKDKEKSLEQELLEILQKRSGITSNALNDQQDIANVLRDQARQLKFQNAEKTLLRKTANDLTKIAQKNYTLSSEELGTIKGLESLSKDRTTIEKSIIILKQQQNKFSKSELELDQDIASSIKMQVSESKNLLNEIKSIEEGSNQVANAFGVKTFGAISDITNAIPGLKRFSKPFSDAAEAARAHGAAQVEMLRSGKGLTKEKIQELGLTEKLTTTNEKGEKIVLTGRAAANKLSKEGVEIQGTFMAGVKSLGPALTKALGPLALLSNLFNVIKGVDKEAGEFAKNMGISYDESLALRSEMSKVSRNNKDILITSKELIKAQSELNEFFGQSVAFSGEIASEFASIQKRTGLSTKALGIFTRTAMESGVATEDVLVNIEKTRLEQNNLNKLSLSSKQIQEGIAEASNAFQLSVGKSVTELTKAFFASKQLGASFQQLEGLADNLLDFESSIQSELQAELLTGRQLNLEKARQAALDNDLVTLATEIKNQVGSAAEFGEMNRIQQEAIAKSIGMQRGELANVLMEQENINALQGIFGSGVESLSDAQKQYNKLKSEGRLTEEQTNALAKEGLDNQMATASVAARFEAIILRVQEIFIGFAEPILGIVDGIASMVGGAEHLANILVGIAGTYALIKGYTLATSIYETAILARKMAQGSLDARALFLGKSKLVQTIGQAIASIFSGSATLGPFGIPLAIAGVAALTGAIASASALADDIAIPSGYGERMILGPEGSIALNNRDTIVAGTDLFKADDMTLSPEGTNTVVNNQNTTVDNTALVTKMDQLIAVNERILAKSSVIEMNGNQVGQEINTSERAIQ